MQEDEINSIDWYWLVITRNHPWYDHFFFLPNLF